MCAREHVRVMGSMAPPLVVIVPARVRWRLLLVQAIFPLGGGDGCGMVLLGVVRCTRHGPGMLLECDGLHGAEKPLHEIQ